MVVVCCAGFFVALLEAEAGSHPPDSEVVRKPVAVVFAVRSLALRLLQALRAQGALLSMLAPRVVAVELVPQRLVLVAKGAGRAVAPALSAFAVSVRFPTPIRRLRILRARHRLRRAQKRPAPALVVAAVVAAGSVCRARAAESQVLVSAFAIKALSSHLAA